jgi:inactivated superfamily I helicase
VQGYPKPFAEGISRSCMEQASKQSSKLPPAVVTSYCQCVAAQVQSRVSFADFVDLSNALNAKQTLNEQQTKNNAALTAGVQYCVSQQQPGTGR